MTLKTCFVVGPIGAVGSEVRAWSDDLFFNLIKPVCSQEGIDANRIIDDSRPGDITQHIMQAVLDADLVIADLSGHNPNAFYELAVRHLVGKPFIHLTQDTGKIPFDINVLSAIHVDRSSFGGLRQAIAALTSHIISIKEGKCSFITASADQYRRISAAAKDKPTDEMKVMISELKSQEIQMQELRMQVTRLAREKESLTGSLQAAEQQIKNLSGLVLTGPSSYGVRLSDGFLSFITPGSTGRTVGDLMSTNLLNPLGLGPTGIGTTWPSPEVKK